LRFAQPEYITALAISPDANVVATAGGKRAFLWSSDTGRIVREIPASGWIKTLAFSRSGKHLAVARQTGDIELWNTVTGERHWPGNRSVPKSSKQATVTALRFIANDRLLVAAHDEPRVQVWDVQSGIPSKEWDVDEEKRRQIQSYGSDYSYVAVALSPSGEQMAWLAGVSRNSRNLDRHSSVFLHESATGRLVRAVKGLESGPERIHLLDEGETVLLQAGGISEKGENAIVGTRDGKERSRFGYRITHFISRPIGEQFFVQVMGVSPDSKFLFTGDEAGMSRRDLATGKPLEECDVGGHLLAFSADGNKSVLAHGSRWRMCDAKLKPMHPQVDAWKAQLVHYAPDGRLLAQPWVHSGRLTVWDPKQGKILETLSPRPAPLAGRIPASYDSWRKRFVCCQDEALVVHDLLTDTQVCRLAGVRVRENEVWSVIPSLSPDGKRVLVSSREKNVILVRWFDSQTGRELGRCSIPEAASISRSPWLSQDGTVFGYVTPDNRLALVDCQSRKLLLQVGTPARLAASATWDFKDACGETCILASRRIPDKEGGCQFALFERMKGRSIRRFILKPKDAEDIYWGSTLSRDGRLLATHKHEADQIQIYETASGRCRGQIKVPSVIRSLAFAPDNRTLAVSCEDTSILIWDLNRPFSGRAPVSLPSTPAERGMLWHMLADPDAAAAEVAIWALVRAPDQALPMLKSRLKPASSPGVDHIRELIARLASESFKDREAAARELVALGELTVPALRDTVESPSTLEQRHRAEKLLARLENAGLSPDDIRELRAIEILERIATPAAWHLLTTIGAGPSDARITHEARLAIKRLETANP